MYALSKTNTNSKIQQQNIKTIAACGKHISITAPM